MAQISVSNLKFAVIQSADLCVSQRHSHLIKLQLLIYAKRVQNKMFGWLIENKNCFFADGFQSVFTKRGAERDCGRRQHKGRRNEECDES